MKRLSHTFYLILVLIVDTFGQSSLPDNYTALQTQLKNQPDSVQIDQLADFIRAKVEQGNFMEATSASQEMMTIAKRTGNPLFLGRTYISAGYIARNEGNPTQAIVNFQQAATIYQANNEWHQQVVTLERIGNVYIDVRNLSLAESYHTNALAIARKHNLTKDIADVYTNLATVYDIRGQLPKALALNEQSIKTLQSINADYSFTLLNRGIILKNVGRYAESAAIYYQTLTLAEKQKDEFLKYLVYVNIPNTLLRMNRLDEAERYSRLALQSAYKQPNLQNSLQEIYETLTTIYEKRGQYQQALAYHKQWAVHRDSVFNAEKSRQLVEAETRFQTREKQQQIQRLDEDNLRQKHQLWLLIGGILLLALLLATMGWQYRALRRANERVNHTLTELQRTQARLIQQEKMASLGELTAGIAHEIQNPLNFVNNFSEVNVDLTRELQEELDKVNLPADDKAYLNDIVSDIASNQTKINQHGQRAAGIVRGMLEHSRTSTGERQSTSLNPLINEYLRIAYSGIQAKDKQFSAQLLTELDPAVGKIEVVPQEIGRVLVNLFNNAFYALQQQSRNPAGLEAYQPTLRVRSKRLADSVEICVSDNGTGIQETAKNKIFQPFFTTKPTGEGTGLGLSLSYDIVTKGHGGTLVVESTQGAGSTFCLTLPV
jgi:signal transduction histidine kinase